MLLLVVLTAVEVVAAVIFGLVVWRRGPFASDRMTDAARNRWWPASGFTMFGAGLAAQVLGEASPQILRWIWGGMFVPVILIGLYSIVRGRSGEEA